MKIQIYVVLLALSMHSAEALGQCVKPEMDPVWGHGQATIQMCGYRGFGSVVARRGRFAQGRQGVL
jgi:hypothetical protein